MRRIEYYKNRPERLKTLRNEDKEYQRKKRKRIKGYKAKEFALYRKKYPEKCRAHQRLNWAVKSGKIKKSPCSVCGSEYRIQGHHPDYSKPLKVIWLCSLHHKEIHNK